MSAASALLAKGLLAAAMVAGAGWFALGTHLLDLSGPQPGLEGSMESQTDGPLAVPVEGVDRDALFDTFGDARAEGKPHDAIDIMAPLGTPVRAAANGRLEKLFVSQAGGNTIYERSEDGRTMFYYAHLDRYAAGLREGQGLRRGQVIGAVGYSGNADPAAPHLHFAMMRTEPARHWWESGPAINPYPLLTGRERHDRPE